MGFPATSHGLRSYLSPCPQSQVSKYVQFASPFGPAKAFAMLVLLAREWGYCGASDSNEYGIGLPAGCARHGTPTNPKDAYANSIFWERLRPCCKVNGKSVPLLPYCHHLLIVCAHAFSLFVRVLLQDLPAFVLHTWISTNQLLPIKRVVLGFDRIPSPTD